MRIGPNHSRPHVDDKTLTPTRKREIDDYAEEMVSALLSTQTKKPDSGLLLSTLEKNKWNLTKTFKDLGISTKEDIISVFRQYKLLGKLKLVVESKLKEKRGSVDQLAIDFGIPQFTCASLVLKVKVLSATELDEEAPTCDDKPASIGDPQKVQLPTIEPSAFKKIQLLKALEECKWKIPTAKSNLGIPKTKTTIEVFTDFNAISELKQKFISMLKQRDYILNDVSLDLGISLNESLELTLLCRDEILDRKPNTLAGHLISINPHHGDAVSKLANSLFGGQPLIYLRKLYSADVINIWNSSTQDIRRLARYVGVPDGTPQIRIFLHYGIADHLKQRITGYLDEYEQNADKVACTFGISQKELKELCDFFKIELPGLFNDDDIKRVIKEELENLLDVYIPYFATRYSYHVINILWGVVSSRLKGTYDPDKLKELVNEHIVLMVDRELDEEEVLQSVRQARESDSDTGIVCLDPHSISSEDIRRMAKKIDRTLEERIIDEGIREVVSSQAFIFLRKLEEKRLFREFDLLGMDKRTPEHAIAEINRVINSESGIIKRVLEDLKEEFQETIPIREKLYELGLKETTTLNLYQLVGILRMIKAKKVLQADKMGLGKTLQTISTFLLSNKDEMVVIGPKAALIRWMEDFADHTKCNLEVALLTEEPPAKCLLNCNQITVKTFEDTRERLEYFLSDREKPASKRIILMNYDILPTLAKLKHQKSVEKITVDFLALDEVHLLKNPGTARSSVVFGTKSHDDINGDLNGSFGIDAEYKFLITGTPLENESKDVLGYLRYVSIGSKGKAEELFVQSDRRTLSCVFRSSDPESMSLLHSFLSSKMVRRLKEDVLTELPQKRFVVAKLDPLNKVMILNDREVIPLRGDYSTQFYLYDMALNNPIDFERLYGSRASTDEVESQEEAEQRFLGKYTQITRLDQLATDPNIFGVPCDSIKLDAVSELVRSRFEDGKSIIVFNNYVGPARNLRDKLISAYGAEEISYVDGKVVNKRFNPARSNEVHKFQDGRSHIFDATIWTMGQSRDLTQADCVIFLNYPWNQSTIDQGIDRVHRYDPIRNYVGKEIEVIFLEVAHPVPIDTLKGRVIKKKGVLEQMVVEGNLHPTILSAFKECDETVIEQVKTAPREPVPEDRYELTIGQRLALIMDEISRTESPDKRTELFNEAAALYAQFLEHKSTFYGNMANLDVLSGDMFPQLKGRDLTGLDLGCGPSVLYHAREKKKVELGERNFRLTKIIDFDVSPLMLALGGNKEGIQIVGSFKNLKEIPSNSADIVNVSHAWRYTEHPAELVENIHRILVDNGVCTLLFPKNYVISSTFEESFINAGFDVCVGSGSKLQSRLDDKSYNELLGRYGKEIADDIASEARADFTYFVANKRRTRSKKLNDEDFKLDRRTNVVATIGKIKQLIGPSNKPMNLPEGGTVEGIIIKDDSSNKVYRRLHRKISEISRIASVAASAKARDQKSKLRLQKALNEVVSRLEAITRESENLEGLSNSEREKLILDIEALRNKDRIGQVLRLYDSQIDEIVNELRQPALR